MHLLGIDLPPAVLFLGLCSGLMYGTLGVGLVLIYRTSRFLNFAHGQVGAFGAAMFAVLVTQLHVPYWVGLPCGLLISGVISAGVEIGVVRRLAGAPKLMSMVGTLGIGSFLYFVSLAISARATGGGSFFPLPTGLPSFSIGRQPVSQAYVGMLVLAPIAVLALTAFFRYGRVGLAIRAASANPDAAAMAAMSPTRLSTLTWGIAGALSCLTASLLIPTLGALGGSSVGPTFLLRALAAGVVGKMTNLPATFAAGVGIGVVERLVGLNTGDQSFTDVLLLGLIVVSLLTQAKPGRREQEKGSWATVQAWPPLPEQVERIWLVRNLGVLLGAVAFAAALVVPIFLTNQRAFVAATLLSYVIVGCSLFVVTGLAGQLSLGQFGIAAAGAVAAVIVSDAVGNHLAGALAGMIAGAVVSVLLGVPALRVQGLLLAVTTLGFAIAMSSWVLDQPAPFGFGGGRSTGSITVFGADLMLSRRYYYVPLVALGLVLLVLRNIRRSELGRVLVAVRDNADAARAFSVAAPARLLQAYAISGAIAGLGGSVYAFAQSSVASASFVPLRSILVVVMAVVGGIGIVPGALLGAVVSLDQVANLDIAVQVAITTAWLLLVLYCPNGIAGLIRPVRDAVIDLIARAHGVDPAEARRSADPALAAASTDSEPARATVRTITPAPERDPDEVLLSVRGIAKRYGGLVAVDGVDLDVRAGEVLGLIGPNGAGKTTLFECLSGFVRVDSGVIDLSGRDITRWSPERRARAGLIRSFQDSALFGTMTVLETVMVSMERTHPSRVVPSLLGLQRVDRVREQRARELVALMGLDRYRHTQVGALSTGTRRIAELACVIGLEPTLLLLDEPSSGVAQREVEALGDVLREVRRQLGATMVVIEHDIPLVSALSDRMVAMETGRVLCVGTPSEVLADDRVVESYLGGELVAVNRSAAGEAIATGSR